MKLTHLPPQTISFPRELIEASTTHCLVQAPQTAMVESIGDLLYWDSLMCDSIDDWLTLDTAPSSNRRFIHYFAIVTAFREQNIRNVWNIHVRVLFP